MKFGGFEWPPSTLGSPVPWFAIQQQVANQQLLRGLHAQCGYSKKPETFEFRGPCKREREMFWGIRGPMFLFHFHQNTAAQLLEMTKQQGNKHPDLGLEVNNPRLGAFFSSFVELCRGYARVPGREWRRQIVDLRSANNMPNIQALPSPFRGLKNGQSNLESIWLDHHILASPDLWIPI